MHRPSIAFVYKRHQQVSLQHNNSNTIFFKSMTARKMDVNEKEMYENRQTDLMAYNHNFFFFFSSPLFPYKASCLIELFFTLFFPSSLDASSLLVRRRGPMMMSDFEANKLLHSCSHCEWVWLVARLLTAVLCPLSPVRFSFFAVNNKHFQCARYSLAF